MKQLKFALQLLVFSFFFLTACSKDDTNPEGSGSNNNQLPAGPQDTVTSFMVFFTNTTDSMTEVGSYDDPDGPGPKPANIGGVVLKKNESYIVTINLEDATNNPKVFLHTKIKNNGKDYKVCLSNPLGSTVVPTDSDGNMPIGLINLMTTGSSTGNEQMNFTIKYQKGTKSGSCSPGVVYYSCNIPVFIN
ncbi:MAG: hypothetical protein JNM67_08020 [Bacteroidetes bacterium]|nr:hypothetical protein [Bacteroidota bacterium]